MPLTKYLLREGKGGREGRHCDLPTLADLRRASRWRWPRAGINSLGREERTRPSGKEKGPGRVQLEGAAGGR